MELILLLAQAHSHRFPGIFLAPIPCLAFFFMGTLGLAATVFWIWMLVDCATKEPDEGNNKLIWILIIVLTGWLGALIYLIVRRPQRIRETGR